MTTKRISMRRIGDALRETRTKRGLTLDQAAPQLGMTKSQLSYYERGFVSGPDVNTVYKLCQWMGRSMYDFAEHPESAAA